jgi:branched-chain amino acid transport system permease protein
MNLDLIPQVLVQGVVSGSWYAGVALGFALLYRSTGIFNFAVGQIFVLAPYLFISLVPHMAWGLALVGALLGAALLQVVIDRLLMPRMSTRNHLAIAILTLGVANMIEAAIAYFWGYSERQLPSPIAGNPVLTLPFGVRLPVLQLIGVGMIVVLFAAVLLLWEKTPLGLRMRASAESQVLAGISGISYRSAALTAWAVSGVAAAVAGIAYAMGASLHPSVANVGLLAFPALVLGGLDSMVGAVFGGVILGLVQAAIITWGDPSAQYAVTYALLLVIVLVRPRGLLGSKEILRV